MIYHIVIAFNRRPVTPHHNKALKHKRTEKNAGDGGRRNKVTEFDSNWYDRKSTRERELADAGDLLERSLADLVRSVSPPRRVLKYNVP